MLLLNNSDEGIMENNLQDQNPQRAATEVGKRARKNELVAEKLMRKTKLNG